jgi:hypothetical protein
MLVMINQDDPNSQPQKLGTKAESFVKKMIEDKKIIRQYIKEDKDLSELTEKRGINFAKPI